MEEIVISPKKDGGAMEFKDAYDVMAKTLSEDKDLYYAYQSGIAMSFWDAVVRAGYRFPDLHKISNEAAKEFLDLFIAKSAHAQREEGKS
jgi:hypothetical protein